MKGNYTLDSNKYIVNLVTFPFDESKPWVDDSNFVEGLSRVINGKIDNTLPSERFFELKKDENVSRFREVRTKLLERYDILRINVLNGDIDPETSQPYAPITQAEKQWRLSMLNFTESVTHETKESQYPQTPARIRQ
jgi:hypothetical protein